MTIELVEIRLAELAREKTEAKAEVGEILQDLPEGTIKNTLNEYIDKIINETGDKNKKEVLESLTTYKETLQKKDDDFGNNLSDFWLKIHKHSVEIIDKIIEIFK